MQILDLKLLNFRNYESLELTFSPKCNLIYGLNGTGKTNLVEAIYVLGLTRSFRGSVDKVLIQQDKTLTKIEGSVLNQGKDLYRLVISEDGKTAKVNGNKITKLSDYISKICVVLFSPDDLRMIKDSPSVRRKMVDVEISQLENNYLKYLNIYTKTLKQRNAYLKSLYLNSNESTEYLNILTLKLIDFGLKVHEERKKFVSKLNTFLSNIFEQITGISGLSFEYVSDYEKKSKEDLEKEYHKQLSRDMAFGKTHYGIHHDDYVFYFKDVNMKDYASEGQQKNAVIAFKIAETKMFQSEKNVCPILILDDLFSELDQEKIGHIMNLIDPDVQTFITTTEIDKVDENIRKVSKIFHVTAEEVREECL